MKIRFRVAFLFLLILGGVSGFLHSCSDVFDSDSDETSVSVRFSMNASAGRAADTDSGEYRLVARLVGASTEQERETTVSSGGTVDIRFDNVKSGAKVRVKMALYEGETVVWLGASEEISVRGGENPVSLALRHSRLYVSEGGSDSNSGTEKSPLGSLNAAFDKIADIGISDADWTVFVSGTVSGNSKISAIAARSLTISGVGENAVLDGNGSGKVLKISEDIGFDVTLANLTVQHGKDNTGAGINSDGKGTLTLANCVVRDNAVVKPEGASSGANGGGIAIRYGTLSLVGTTVTENSSEYNAGGIQITDGAKFLMDENSSVTKNTSAYSGGGISIGNETTTTLSAGTISENEAPRGAGIILQKEATTLVLSGVSISNNRANTDSSGSQGNGGGIFINGGSVVLSGGAFSGNSAANGGGAVNLNVGSFTMTGGKISGNTAKNGAGILHNRGSAVLSGGEISGNEAANNGGGLYVNTYKDGAVAGVLKINEGALINGNGAEKSGGGVYVCSGEVEMSGGKIADNAANGGNGGGIDVELYQVKDSEKNVTAVGRTKFAMYGGAISGNTATNCGGGIYLKGSEVSMTGGEISGNEAKQGGGVTVYFVDVTMNGSSQTYSGEFSMDGGNITENSAQEKSGGIFNNKSSLKISGNSTISGNSLTSGTGKNIFLSSAQEATLNGESLLQETTGNVKIDYDIIDGAIADGD